MIIPVTVNTIGILPVVNAAGSRRILILIMLPSAADIVMSHIPSLNMISRGSFTGSSRSAHSGNNKHKISVVSIDYGQRSSNL